MASLSTAVEPIHSEAFDKSGRSAASRRDRGPSHHPRSLPMQDRLAGPASYGPRL